MFNRKPETGKKEKFVFGDGSGKDKYSFSMFLSHDGKGIVRRVQTNVFPVLTLESWQCHTLNGFQSINEMIYTLEAIYTAAKATIAIGFWSINCFRRINHGI